MVVRRFVVRGFRQFFVPMVTVLVASYSRRVCPVVVVCVGVFVGVRVTMHHVSMSVLVLVGVAVSMFMLLRHMGGELLFHVNLRTISRPTLPALPAVWNW